MTTGISESVKIFIVTALVLAAGVVGYLLFDSWKVDHTVTGVTGKGEMRIVYPFKDGGFYFDYYIADEGVIRKAFDTTVGRAKNGKHGAYFDAASEGKTDIYTVWLEDPNTYDYYAEVYHVTVDSSKKITYTTEEITPKEFKHIAKRDRPVLAEEMLRQ